MKNKSILLAYTLLIGACGAQGEEFAVGVQDEELAVGDQGEELTIGDLIAGGENIQVIVGRGGGRICLTFVINQLPV